MASGQDTDPNPGGTDFVIEELTGDQREIRLVGRALPYRPIELSGIQAGDKTWYPGNPIATPQIFGPQEDPSDFNGFWKDRFIKSFTPDGKSVRPEGAIMLNGSPVATVKDAIELLDDVRRKGQMLRLSWAHIVRQGWLQKFSQKWHRVQDCEWGMHFEFVSQGDAQMPTVLSARSSATDIASDFGDAVAAVQVAATPPDGMAIDSDALGALYAGIAKLAADVDALQSAVENSIDAVLTPFDVARQLSAVLSGAVGNCQDLLEQLWSTPPALLLQAGLQNPDSLGSGDVLAVDLWVNDTVSAVRTAQDLAIEQQQNVMVDDDPELLDVFFAQAGTDLRIVSTNYYGTPDNWRDLADYNDIDMGQSELDLGQVVYIPRIQILQRPLASPPDSLQQQRSQ